MGSVLVREDRSVVVPEVPRVRHGGLRGGAHVGGQEAAYLFLEKPVTTQSLSVLDLDR